jgi:hypothetical protein
LSPPSVAGIALAVAALLAFLCRTPLKFAAVDRRRHGRLCRTVIAEQVSSSGSTTRSTRSTPGRASLCRPIAHEEIATMERIIIGYDDSPGARSALKWAV